MLLSKIDFYNHIILGVCEPCKDFLVHHALYSGKENTIFYLLGVCFVSWLNPHLFEVCSNHITIHCCSYKSLLDMVH